jgi:hypothetical protein
VLAREGDVLALGDRPLLGLARREFWFAAIADGE